MDRERPTFCGTSSMQAKGEDTGSENTSSKRSVREGGQRSGWDHNASLMAPGLCPTHPLARAPLSGFLDSLPHVQTQLPGHLPWGTSSLGRASKCLLRAPGASSAPHTGLGLLPHRAVGSSRQGLDGGHPWVPGTARHRAVHLAGITMCFLNEPSVRSSPGCSPWVRYSAPSSKICSGSSFPGELKKEGLRPRISVGWPVTLQVSFRGGPKASGLPEKKTSGLGVWSQIVLSLSTQQHKLIQLK